MPALQVTLDGIVYCYYITTYANITKLVMKGSPDVWSLPEVTRCLLSVDKRPKNDLVVDGKSVAVLRSRHLAESGRQHVFYTSRSRLLV